MRLAHFILLSLLAASSAQKLPSAHDVPLTFSNAESDVIPGSEESDVVPGSTEEESVAEPAAPEAAEEHVRLEGDGFDPRTEEIAAVLESELPEQEEAAVPITEVSQQESTEQAPQESTEGEVAEEAAPVSAIAEMSGGPAADVPVAAAAATPSKPRRGASGTGTRRSRRGKNKNRCRIPGCMRCGEQKGQCASCRRGFALTEELTCAKCGEGCAACSSADTCDTCQPHFTNVNGRCEACAAHCLRCDEAGPGGCNECSARRMLHVRLELHGEVHECLPCGAGCRSCSEDAGCTACENSFYLPQANGLGCYLSWLRVGSLIGCIILVVGGSLYCLAAEDFEDPRASSYQAHRRAQALSERDSAEVVRSRKDAGGTGEIRSRGSRQEHSPPQERTLSATPYSQHLLPGYSGIDIVDKY